MLLIKNFTFDAAHNLVNYKGKCERLHGHTYRLVVKIEGEPDKSDGMVMDFVELKKIVGEHVLDKLDHYYLNDIVGQSTAEHIAVWIWKNLEPALGRDNCRLAEIELWETADSGVVYNGR